ncbi:Fanconi anemia core complex-associated protein 24-like [Ostrea edulis]|uniref:Fanconi anemia core complex-associated protein 24-like n=1 Tax=Ostrea edulis TaxID=37623 RepID=UPI002094E536|nr:Fanconi anemia core complex-associated protein 24-like [Ostrea edulis]
MESAENDDDFDLSSLVEKTCNLNVPIGHIIVSQKWRNSELHQRLKSDVLVLFEDNLGMVDFYPSSRLGVVYITEPDLLTFSGHKKKLAKLRKANRVQVIVLAEKTSTSGQYYPEVQKFCLMDLGFTIIPVPGQNEAASILAQMVVSENQMTANPFLRKKICHVDEALLVTIKSIPGLGGIKARALLEKFGSIENLCRASSQELSVVIGKVGAEHVKNFFDK